MIDESWLRILILVLILGAYFIGLIYYLHRDFHRWKDLIEEKGKKA